MGNGVLDFFNNIEFAWMYGIENITGGSGEFDFFDNIGIV